mmetsp:Transcript_2150/g.4934  ORF Transcript_2150/g.4934 Transcript_2150/m.4934 type:complete len:245 (+) Transcript_2150:342-1076(+)
MSTTCSTLTRARRSFSSRKRARCSSAAAATRTTRPRCTTLTCARACRRAPSQCAPKSRSSSAAARALTYAGTRPRPSSPTGPSSVTSRPRSWAAAWPPRWRSCRATVPWMPPSPGRLAALAAWSSFVRTSSSTTTRASKSRSSGASSRRSPITPKAGCTRSLVMPTCSSLSFRLMRRQSRRLPCSRALCSSITFTLRVVVPFSTIQQMGAARLTFATATVSGACARASASAVATTRTRRQQLRQ